MFRLGDKYLRKEEPFGGLQASVTLEVQYRYSRTNSGIRLTCPLHCLTDEFSWSDKGPVVDPSMRVHPEKRLALGSDVSTVSLISFQRMLGRSL